MIASTPCPDLHDYRQRTSGQLAVAQAESLLHHLESCDVCAGKIQTLPASDTLIEWIRQAKSSTPSPDDKPLAPLMQRLIQLGKPAGTLTFSCAACRKPMRVKQEASGKKVKCPHCGQVVLAPAETPAAPAATVETAFLPPASTSQTANLPASSKERELCAFLSPSQAPDEIGRLGSYRVLKVLGAGGMGVVFRAEDPQLQRLVALKAMLPALAANESARQRFLREARAAAKLKHDHIVTIHQVGEDRGAPFLAMEFLEGEALEDRLKREGKLPLTEVLRIGREIADGLQAAHERGLIHRDIKPANVWLEGKRGRVKILDFGLARSSSDEVHLTQSGAIVGTPAYMPPEQARGDAVDARCDLYSLGCVLFRLCTGELPFKADNAMSLLLALATEPPKSPREINADVPPPLADLILRLLAKKPADRPATASEVADALQDIASAKAPVPEVARVPAPPRRRRKLLGAAAAGVFLLAILATVIVIHLGGPNEGTVTIETVDPDVELVFRSGGRDVTVRDKKKGDEIKLPLGSYQVALKGGKDGLKLETDHFTLKSGERVLVKVTRQAGEKSPTARAKLPPPVEVPEPPPLEDWLKDRKVLTVSQDGKGQFKTIKEALDALKPHQVVKVLDRGPYRESLWTGGMPEDTGLISEQQTVVESASGTDSLCYLGPLDGFRLSGFRLQAAPSFAQFAFCHLIDPSGLVIENCYFGWTKPKDGAVLYVQFRKREDCKPVVVRDCFFHSGYFPFDFEAESGSALVLQRNYFKETNLASTQRFQKVVIRHNVFHNSKAGGMWLENWKEIGEILEISNNTFVTKHDPVSIVKTAPKSGVVLRNNCSERTLLGLDGKAFEDLGGSIKNWQLDHNCYIRRGSLPKAPSDVLAEPPFLSVDPSHPDYMRIAADGPAAKGGAGGDWPSYIGALPPGPAPKDGDWFTRLRQRWGEAAPADKPPSPPVQIPEPPPLAEWLKGRKVLTVSQDGKGQFKTIQAALDALKANQVVKVLDRGPYRERLTLENVPADSGLVSEQGTLLEFSGNWRKVGVEKDLFMGHHLANTAGFRLHGFCFSFPEKKGSFGGLWVDQPDGFVLENCCFQTAGDRFRFFRDEQQFAVCFQANQIEFVRPVVVRQCLFDSCLVFHTHTTHAERRSTDFVLEKNYFAKSQGCTADGDFRKIIIRNNVFDQETVLNLWGQKHAALVEVSNNTVLGNVFFQASAPRGTVILCNNLVTGRQSFDLALGAEKALAEASKNWQTHHNVFQSRGFPTLLPLGVTDCLAPISFLSQEPDNANYLRLPADSPLAKGGAGGDWPSYIGALPPGPAPKDGDWFTRLRDKWMKDKPAANKNP